jgi:hypothetical protein
MMNCDKRAALLNFKARQDTDLSLGEQGPLLSPTERSFCVGGEKISRLQTLDELIDNLREFEMRCADDGGDAAAEQTNRAIEIMNGIQLSEDADVESKEGI